MSFVDLILSRRSVMAKDMVEPGPSEEQLQLILRAAHRVPDHGKLGPWRFVIFQGDRRQTFGEQLAEVFLQENPNASDAMLEFQRGLLMRAPLVIAVISTASEHIKIPVWEQVMSVGAACQNMLLAGTAMGFGGQWLTEWYSYSEGVKKLLAMDPAHNVAGFLYFGSFTTPPEERKRPELDERVSYW